MRENPQVQMISSPLTYIQQHPLPRFYWRRNNFRAEDGRPFSEDAIRSLLQSSCVATPATTES